MTAEALPRVTPFLLDRGPTMCPRRLRRHYQRLGGDDGAFTRGRIRDPLVQDARAAHQEMGPPNPRSFSVRTGLLPEEQALMHRAIDHYLDLFGDEPFQTSDDEAWDRPVESADGTFEVGGWIDLVGHRPDGAVELRQLELWGRQPEADPLRSFSVLLAVLRIRKHARADRVVVRHADLVHGHLAEHDVDLPTAGSELNATFSRRLARVRLRVQEGARVATAGMDCVTCPYANGCPAHR